MYKIYKLVDPRDGNIRYVGITVNNVYKRLIGHLSDAYNRERVFAMKGIWLKELVESGYFPKVEILEETLDKRREDYWIKILKPDLNLMLSNNSLIADRISLLHSKAVYQYSLKGEFMLKWKSTLEVERKLGIEASNISACITGRRKQAGGYIWKDCRFAKLPSYKRHYTTKPVHQYDLSGNYITTYPSLSGIPGFTLKGISKCCNGDCQSHNGFKFSFTKVEDIVRSSEKSETLV